MTKPAQFRVFQNDVASIRMLVALVRDQHDDVLAFELVGNFHERSNI